MNQEWQINLGAATYSQITMTISKISMCLVLAFVIQAGSRFGYISATESSFAEESESREFVVTLDHSNFTDFIAKHEFIVVEFYAPWTFHCKKLAPEYEKAASILSKADPQVVFAKVDAIDPNNKPLANDYEIRGFPTLKILRYGGSVVQEYKGPRDADGIVSYLTMQSVALVELRSEPVPDTNNEPVKVVVADSLQEMVLSSGKNALLEFYAPWCRFSKKLAPTLDDVAVSFENDPDVIIAKFDATANDIPRETFEVIGFPTLYFKSSTGNVVQYYGDRTKEDIIDFIQKHRDTVAKQGCRRVVNKVDHLRYHFKTYIRTRSVAFNLEILPDIW